MQYRTSPQQSLWLNELIVDNFAGGGGASTGIEMALGRPVDIAINHDPDAIAMHTINHPHTTHYCESVWDIDPREVTKDQPVGLVWLSPDCKHFSKAKGSTPVKKEIRGLAWVACKWAGIKSRIIKLENVEEFVTWGSLHAKRCTETRRVVTKELVMDHYTGRMVNRVANPGEVVPIDNQCLVPNKKKAGKHFNAFVNQLRKTGYAVEWRNLVACDYGAPTIRKRFFLIARCDGQPIVWPTPTHGNPARLDFKKSGLKKWKTAADIIDWSIPCPSIFGRKKPLAENTLRRIARGIQRYVIDNPKPFIVRIGQQGFGGTGMQYETSQPLTTITTKAEHCLVVPTLVQTGYGEREGQKPRSLDLDKPLGTIVAGGQKHALVATFLAKHFGGNYTGPGSAIDDPLHTVTAVDHSALVTTHLLHLRNNCDARSVELPIPTLTAGGGHVGEVRAFLIKYYGNEKEGCDITGPLHTVTVQDRFGLVTVRGEQYQIVDIGMRMLEPHELFAAQGFPCDYIIDRDASGNPIPKYKQVARCGNSVCPDLAAALVQANYHADKAAKVA
jgi:DNA (cytosine-5)-methyltransferase 1